MVENILRQPLWLQGWIFWMIVVNTAALFFLRHVEGRRTLAVWIANAITMTALFYAIGYNRGLGLSHVIWWTPLLIWLAPRLRQPHEDRAFAGWLWVLFLTNLTSLVVDYADVVRYFLLGQRPG